MTQAMLIKALLTAAAAGIVCLIWLALSRTPASAQPEPMASQPADQPQPNRLIHSASPYLRQHAYNPVDWYPWTDEALRKAKDENKPIFLSIGYAACHWCHVMAHESFENEEIAAILNQSFIAIKVDREERPDLDEQYMMAVQILTGRGGWPMSVFLTPELQPFFGGTYFPPEPRQGMPGFKELLIRINEAWQDNRSAIREDAARLTAHLQQASQADTETDPLHPELFSKAINAYTQDFDAEYGGFGPAPKFPPAHALRFLLQDYYYSNDADVLKMITVTLDRMADGGLYDHVGGGFHRYAVDRTWLVPHFEKMLYDNAQLSLVYLEAWQATGNQRYLNIARETLDYLIRDMRHNDGGFFSSEDADSEGEEGRFYLWTKDEIENLLGPEKSTIFNSWFQLTDTGNFSSPEPYHNGLNILHRKPDGNPPSEIETMRSKVFNQRTTRIRPGRDDKIITAWNGMVLSSLARAAQITGEAYLLEAAEQTAVFLMQNLWHEGRLYRTWLDSRGSVPGFLDDYAHLAVGLLDLYETTFNLHWLDQAEKITEAMLRECKDRPDAPLRYASLQTEDLLITSRPLHDGAVPSGNAIAASVLQRLGLLTGTQAYKDQAELLIELGMDDMSRAPRGHTSLLSAAHFSAHTPVEFVLAGPLEHESTAAMLKAIHQKYIPHRILALADPESPNNKQLIERLPLLAGRLPVNDCTALYICYNAACQLPITDPLEIDKQLQRNRP